jgi:hypothetical protein
MPVTCRQRRTKADMQSTQVAELLVRVPGQSCQWYAATLGASVKSITTQLHRLRQKAWARVEHPAHVKNNVGAWHPTELLRTLVQDGAHVRTLDRQVLAHLTEANRPLTCREIATALGRYEVSVRKVLAFLLDRGEVTMDTASGVARWSVPLDDDDEPWTPPPYVPALRAQILGLDRARG